MRSVKRWASLGVGTVVVAYLAVFGSLAARADYRITRDFGGLIEEYKARYAMLRDRKERVIIDGVCNSACTLVLGIVPRHRICVTPRASLGFHEAYYDKRWTAGVRVASAAGTAELMAIYPPPVKNWIARQGGLTPSMKRIKNGIDLWTILDPCPEDF